MYLAKQEDNVKLPPFQQHEDDDGGTKKWSDCSEGNHAVLGGKGAKPVAQQGDDRTQEHRGGQENSMILGRDEETRNVGRGQTDEGDGPTEGGDRGGENACDKEQKKAELAGVVTQVLCIQLAQEKGIERLDKRQSRQEEKTNHHGCHRDAGDRDVAETAHSPDGVRLHALARGKEVEQRDGAVGQITDHQTDDEQHGAAAHYSRKCRDERRHR